MTDWRGGLYGFLTPALREALAGLPADAVREAAQLRIRAEAQARLDGRNAIPLRVVTKAADVAKMADAMLGHAAHARQEELRHGFVTLAGGLRAGLAGRAIVRDGVIRALQDISSISIRIAREVPGAADSLMPYLLDQRRPVSALLVSPPGAGKTTMLRDAARQLSNIGFAVSIVDERSELAACLRGVPQLDVGENTDVLDGCPKADGIRIMLRAMSPAIIVTDEIGRPEDAEAVAEAARCGVAVIATAHGQGVHGIRTRTFDRIVTLEPVGQIARITDTEGNALG